MSTMSDYADYLAALWQQDADEAEYDAEHRTTRWDREIEAAEAKRDNQRDRDDDEQRA